MESRCLKWIILVSMLTYGVSEFICPESAEYGYSAQTTCVYSDQNAVAYTSPKDGSVGSCVQDTCSNFGRPRYNVTYINANQSSLEIKNISIHDEGTWTCTATQVYTCNLVVRKTPTCHITSGNDTNNLDIHENISLSVNVTDYYCSTSFDFLLRVGNTEEVLIKSTVKEMNITSDVLNSTFNVTESHIGSLELIFICNNVNKTVHCGGVQSLKKRPPMCNITTDGDTGGWEVGDEITMYVYIEDYSCSGDLDFFLLPGGDTDRLNVTGIYNETITFTVKVSHFGPVYLEMNCNDVSRILTCYGIQELSKRQHTTTSITLHQGGVEYGGWTSFIILFGVGTGVAGTLFLVGLCHLVIYLMRRKNTGCVSGNQYDGFKGRDNDAKTGYDEIGIPRSQESDTAEGGEYEMPGNQYYNVQGGNDDDTTGYVEVDIPRSRDNFNTEVMFR